VFGLRLRRCPVRPNGRSHQGPTLSENGLATGDRPPLLFYIARRSKLFGLSLQPEFEQRLGRVLPDQPNLFVTHLSKFTRFGHICRPEKCTADKKTRTCRPRTVTREERKSSLTATDYRSNYSHG
jgi:hypothetical protein